MPKIFVSIFLLAAFYVVCPAQDGKQTAALNLIVAGQSNASVEDLKKEEIALFIDGKPQTVLSLEKRELPLIYGLAIDCSGSLRTTFRDVKSAAQTIVGLNRMDDETMLVSFVSADKITATKGFSTDKNLLLKTIDEFSVEPGATALTDAIYLTVQAVAKYKRDDAKNQRRAVIVLTDGEDRDSFYSEKALLDLLAKENVQVFFIGLTDDLNANGGLVARSIKGKSLEFMKSVAQASGGAVISRSRKDLKESSAAILPLVRTQYLLSYQPLADGKSAAPKIDIKLAKNSPHKDLNFYFRQPD